MKKIFFGKELIKLDTDNEEYEYTITKKKRHKMK